MTNNPEIPGVPTPDGLSPYGPVPPSQPPQGGQVTPYGTPDQSPYGGPSPYGAPPAGPAPYGAAPGPGPAYGAAPYGSPNPYLQQPQQHRTNPLAIVAICCAGGGFLLQWVLPFFGLGMVAGVVCGHIALSQISRTGEQGRGLALTGVIIGYVGIGIGLLWTLLWLLIFAPLFGYGLLHPSY